jgi:hypothetical protein
MLLVAIIAVSPFASISAAEHNALCRALPLIGNGEARDHEPSHPSQDFHFRFRNRPTAKI